MLLQSNPPAIIFVNNDLSNQVKNMLITQLKIDQVFDGYTFDQTVAADPSWVTNIKNIHEQRILVIRPLYEMTNRELADVVGFVSHGLISIEYNKFGPPGITYPVSKIHWGQLCIFVQKVGPGEIYNSCGCCGYNFYNPIRAELDELNRRVCSTCTSCSSCCSCRVPTFKTLLIPHIPKTNSSRSGV